ncbi:MAG TPA: hypothetical protein VGH74_20300 [Planctomycetaceae bacterium]|jgi:hypothetical protein
MDAADRGLLLRMGATLKGIQFCLAIAIIGILGSTAFIQMELLQLREEIKQLRAEVRALAPAGK